MDALRRSNAIRISDLRCKAAAAWKEYGCSEGSMRYRADAAIQARWCGKIADDLMKFDKNVCKLPHYCGTI